MSPNGSKYAPNAVDITRLANTMLKDVHKLGEATAAEVDETAEALMRGAQDIADKLHQLADAMRAASQATNDHMTDYCHLATSVFERVTELQQQLFPASGQAPGGLQIDDPRHAGAELRFSTQLPDLPR